MEIHTFKNPQLPLASNELRSVIDLGGAIGFAIMGTRPLYGRALTVRDEQVGELPVVVRRDQVRA